MPKEAHRNTWRSNPCHRLLLYHHLAGLAECILVADPVVLHTVVRTAVLRNSALGVARSSLLAVVLCRCFHCQYLWLQGLGHN